MQSIFNFHVRPRDRDHGGVAAGVTRPLSVPILFSSRVFRVGGFLSAFSRSLYYTADTAKNEYSARHRPYLTGGSLYNA
jgi:hypothetical protein